MQQARTSIVEEIEILEELNKRKASVTVVGLVCPEKGHTHSIKKVFGKWVKTTSKPDMYLAAKLERVIKSDKRFISVIGGRGSSKSLGVGDICAIKAKDEGIKTFCLREYQSSIKNSVHALLKDEIKRLELDGFEVLDQSIKHNGKDVFQFAGLARNVESIKSAHGFETYWIEEGQGISGNSLKELTPTARNKPNKGLPGDKLEEVDLDAVSMTFVANPASSEDPFSKRFIMPFKDVLDRDGYYEDDLHLVVVINYTDNPWFAESGLEKERQFDFEHKSRAEYDHIWLGAFNDDVENSIIQSEWFDAAIDAHLVKNFKARGIKVASHDPSDTGPDAKGLALRHGVVLLDAQEITTGDVNEGCDEATDYAIQHDADEFVYDADGLGATLRRQVNQAFEGKKMRVTAFKGSEGVARPNETYQGKNDLVDETVKPKTNLETFKNRRSQEYLSLADRFYNAYRCVILGEYVDPDDMISVSSGIKQITKLRSELCRIPRKPNGAGKIQIMTKIEMRALGIPSPNMADAVYMAYSCDGVVVTKKPKHIKMKFAQRL